MKASTSPLAGLPKWKEWPLLAQKESWRARMRAGLRRLWDFFNGIG